MPLYFAYGSNLDRVDMRRRCPASVARGEARLDDHRFIIAARGYATVVPSPGDVVHGLLWNLAPEDVPALDAYEEVDEGLYRKAMVLVDAGSGLHEALIYLAEADAEGTPHPGYMQAIIAAASRCTFPTIYRELLTRWLPDP